MMHCNEHHWRCPFFLYCWEEGFKMPLVDNYPDVTVFIKITNLSRHALMIEIADRSSGRDVINMIGVSLCMIS